jgi:hypothetical protein
MSLSSFLIGEHEFHSGNIICSSFSVAVDYNAGITQ